MPTVKITSPISESDFRLQEAYKSLRSNLQFCGPDFKVIAFTSCMPNEGKSSVSLQVAISLAELGKKVLLVDADLRKSVLMRKLKVTSKGVRGLSHYLSGQYPLDEVLNATNIENLSIIFAGPVPPNPAELLGSSLFQNLVTAFRSVYDYVIIDTPPLGSVIDSAVVAQNCDGAVMVIGANTISYRFAQEIRDQLEKSNCKILGVVLNKVNVKSRRYYGKYYGKYYGGYGDYYGTAEGR